MVRGIRPLTDLVSVYRMIRLVQKIRPNIVHSFTPKAGLVCMLAAVLCHIPVRVHTFTGLIWPTSVGFLKYLLKVVDRLICACATHIIPESMGVKNDLILGRITKKRLDIIGFGNIAGIDLDYFKPDADGLDIAADYLKNQIGIKGTEFIYIFVGRLHKEKGLEELLKAFARMPTECRLILSGALDPEGPLSEKAINIIHNHDRVHWLGFLIDVRPLFAIANVLVLPSYREGFPNVLIQAGAMSLPVIATNVNGSNEIIESGLNGWLVPPMNSTALEAVMRDALNTPPEKLICFGQAGRARVKERFERNKHWGRLVTYYRSLKE